MQSLIGQPRQILDLGQQQIFSQTIERLHAHIERNFLADDPKTTVILDELSYFDKLDIVPELPNISGSERAVSAFIEAEHKISPSKDRPRLALPAERETEAVVDKVDVDEADAQPVVQKKSSAEAIEHGGNR